MFNLTSYLYLRVAAFRINFKLSWLMDYRTDAWFYTRLHCEVKLGKIKLDFFLAYLMYTSDNVVTNNTFAEVCVGRVYKFRDFNEFYRFSQSTALQCSRLNNSHKLFYAKYFRFLIAACFSVSRMKKKISFYQLSFFFIIFKSSTRLLLSKFVSKLK